MGRVSIMSCLVTAGLVAYGAVGLSGLATGVSIGWSETRGAIGFPADATTARDVIASRFPSAASQDAVPAEAAMLRAAVLRADSIMTPSSRMLRSAALRYGVLESGLRPGELVPYGTTEVSLASARNSDSTTSWHEAFIARMLTVDQAVNFTIRPALTAPTITGGAGRPAPFSPTVAAVRLAEASSQPTPTAREAAPHHHLRPGAVLNDAQIASIKTRLNLTPDQQRMWPAVEAALRNISYTKTASAPQARTDSRLAYVDPDGPEVQQLKYAALPLIMRMSDDQKREVKSLAHVMGLDDLLSGIASWF